MGAEVEADVDGESDDVKQDGVEGFGFGEQNSASLGVMFFCLGKSFVLFVGGDGITSHIAVAAKTPGGVGDVFFDFQTDECIS